MNMFRTLTWIVLATGASSALAQPITEIPFDQIPENSELVSASIHLDGDVSSSGEVGTDIGFRFSDGSLQTTPASSAVVTESTTANSGLYSNKIVEFVPPAGYVEICFKAGSILSDFHNISESTAGGNCLPGDIGWVIERDERAASSWTNARVACLMHGMRLPEPMEWQYTCEQSMVFGVNNMTGNWEWASNQSQSEFATEGRTVAAVSGDQGCSYAGFSNLGNNSGLQSERYYRCAR